MRRQTISFLVIAGIALLAACHGNQSFTPVAQPQQDAARIGGATLPFIPSGIDPHVFSGCTAPQYKPKAGPFIIFVANGNVKKDDFKSAPSPFTLWAAIKIKKSTKPTPVPSGSPSPGSSPTPPPHDQPTYLYFGEYTLAKTKQTGCAYLFATQSGKPFTGSKYSGLAFGSPTIKYPKYYKQKVLATGPVILKYVSLSSSGGKGTATLKLNNGSTYDTAAVTFTYRLASP
ncbi:MAG TPA: hypothetical protein VKB39_00100 [Candidatus Baltobacteraceae bacterium]|nr:hypothetical protein [Candidatus Baltobacteraceae bacterium]